MKDFWIEVRKIDDTYRTRNGTHDRTYSSDKEKPDNPRPEQAGIADITLPGQPTKPPGAVDSGKIHLHPAGSAPAGRQ